MECLKAEILAAYVDGTLDETARRDAEGHLAECAKCRAEARGIAAALEDAKVPGAPEGTDERIAGRAIAQIGRRKIFRRGFFAAAAAVFFVALGAAFTSLQAENAAVISQAHIRVYEPDQNVSHLADYGDEVRARVVTDLDGETAGRNDSGGWTLDDYNALGRGLVVDRNERASGETYRRGGGVSFDLRLDGAYPERHANLFYLTDGAKITNPRGEMTNLPLSPRATTLGVDLAPRRGPQSALESPEAISATMEKVEKGTITLKELGTTLNSSLLMKDDEKISVYGYTGECEWRKEGKAAQEPAPAQEGLKIIRNGDLNLEVEAYEETYAKIGRIVAGAKGFVAGANTQKLSNGKIKATVTVRVPPVQFEAVLAEFRKLGTVRHQSITTRDVTKQYVDLEARLGAKRTLEARLKRIITEGKGTVKELLAAEVELGKVVEQIESIKGELKYLDNQVGLSTIVLSISEKDLGRPFEYVQTLSSSIGLSVADPDDVYAKAQKTITDAGGRIVDARMNRNAGTATGNVKAKVDAEKFPEVREQLKALGHVTNDKVDRQRTARGGAGDAPGPDAPLRREEALVDLTIQSLPIVVTRMARIEVRTPEVERIYEKGRQAVLDASGAISDGSLQGDKSGKSARLLVHVSASRFAELVGKFKEEGEVLTDTLNTRLPPTSLDGKIQPLDERAEIEFLLQTPPSLIEEEASLGKLLGALGWSVENLFVGIFLAGPWVLLVFVVWYFYRRHRRRKAAA